MLLFNNIFKIKFFTVLGFIVIQPDIAEAILNESLRTQLLVMVQEDQQMRKQMLIADCQEVQCKIIQLNHAHAIYMHNVLETYGWPGHNVVGEDGSHAAWLLIQHADHDLALQEKALALLGDAVAANNASIVDYAYLTDRVLINQGKLQKYGTQLKQQNGCYVPKPLENQDNVDQLRTSIGMNTLAEYIDFAQSCSK